MERVIPAMGILVAMRIPAVAAVHLYWKHAAEEVDLIGTVSANRSACAPPQCQRCATPNANSTVHSAEAMLAFWTRARATPQKSVRN